MTASTPSTDIIEGSFRVVETRLAPLNRKSPKRQRAVARIILWNVVLVSAAVVLPHLIR